MMCTQNDWKAFRPVCSLTVSSCGFAAFQLAFVQVAELERRIEQLQRDVQQKTYQVDNLTASQEKYKRNEQEHKRQVGFCLAGSIIRQSS